MCHGWFIVVHSTVKPTLIDSVMTTLHWSVNYCCSICMFRYSYFVLFNSWRGCSLGWWMSFCFKKSKQIPSFFGHTTYRSQWHGDTSDFVYDWNPHIPFKFKPSTEVKFRIQNLDPLLKTIGDPPMKDVFVDLFWSYMYQNDREYILQYFYYTLSKFIEPNINDITTLRPWRKKYVL